MNVPKQSVHVHKRRWFGLLVLRIGLGVIFIAHGVGKISAMSQTSDFFGSIGFSAVVAQVVAYVELLGGVALLLGVFTQVAATILAVIMSVVLLYVKQQASITGMQGNELELALFVSSVALAFMGAGRFSLGAHLCRCCKNGTCAVKKWCVCHVACGGEHCGGAECDKCEDCMEGALCTDHEIDAR